MQSCSFKIQILRETALYPKLLFREVYKQQKCELRYSSPTLIETPRSEFSGKTRKKNPKDRSDKFSTAIT